MPVVENVDDGVRITIKRMIKEKSVQECIADKIDNVVKDVVKDVTSELTERQQDIYTLMKADVVKDVVITAASLERCLSVSERTIQRDLETLQRKGLIKRSGSKKDGVWNVMA